VTVHSFYLFGFFVFDLTKTFLSSRPAWATERDPDSKTAIKINLSYCYSLNMSSKVSSIVKVNTQIHMLMFGGGTLKSGRWDPHDAIRDFVR
jgi:hypothetical protein